jgi:protein-S-isoprenylcysteine O-methyltransferase Ste14
MSLIRVSLVLLQALANSLACTPPNKTQDKRRYHKEELYILQIAPFVFKVRRSFFQYVYLMLTRLLRRQIHMTIAWICALFESLYFLSEYFSLSSHSPMSSAVICPKSSNPNIHTSSIFVMGVVAVALGSYIRLDCFKALGELFTFDLTVHPNHRLITSRFYGYVRHPAYTGSMLMIMGLGLSHLTTGSWLTECGPLNATGSAIVVCAAWWMWTLAVGLSRAAAEDAQMKKLFPDEWEKYAANVQWWFFPGLA